MAVEAVAGMGGAPGTHADDGAAGVRDWRRLTTAELRAECQKGRGEIFLVSHYVYRPFSIYLTMLYARLGARANTVTVHSCVAALVAAGCCLYPSRAALIAAAAGLQAYFVLDHVDGELARMRLWTREDSPNPSGPFLDFWVHFHSINLVVACLGIGLTVQSGQMIWAVAGLVACNVLSNFTKLTLARTLLREHARLAAGPAARALTEYAADVETPMFSPAAVRRQQLFQTARELFSYPGPVVILSATLAADAVLWSATGVAAPISKAYLAAFAGLGLAAKLLRTRRIVGSLQTVGLE